MELKSSKYYIYATKSGRKKTLERVRGAGRNGLERDPERVSVVEVIPESVGPGPRITGPRAKNVMGAIIENESDYEDTNSDMDFFDACLAADNRRKELLDPMYSSSDSDSDAGSAGCDDEQDTDSLAPSHPRARASNPMLELKPKSGCLESLRQCLTDSSTTTILTEIKGEENSVRNFNRSMSDKIASQCEIADKVYEQFVQIRMGEDLLEQGEESESTEAEFLSNMDNHIACLSKALNCLVDIPTQLSKQRLLTRGLEWECVRSLVLVYRWMVYDCPELASILSCMYLAKSPELGYVFYLCSGLCLPINIDALS
jgi:hypothetical protein